MTADLAQKALEAKLEKEWDSDLFNSKKGLATLLGWGSFHVLHSKGSRPGYPDRTLWKDRTLFAELKRELTGRKSEDANRRPSDAQVRILDGLARGGSEVYLWRPSDLDEIASILSKPWRFYRFVGSRVSFDKPPHLQLGAGASDVWVPRSIWIPGAGRADEAGVS